MATIDDAPGLVISERERKVLRKRALFDSADLGGLFDGEFRKAKVDEARKVLAEIQGFMTLLEQIGFTDDTEPAENVRVDVVLWGEAMILALDRMENYIGEERDDEFKCSPAAFERMRDALEGELDPDAGLGDELLHTAWVVHRVKERLRVAQAAS